MSYILKYLLLNVLAPIIPHPKLRSRYLKLLGAKIGKGVRIENVRFIQIQGTIANLQCGDNTFIGTNVIIDLSERLVLGLNSIVAPGCTLMTHQDFGDFNGNLIRQLYPRKESPIIIGDDVVIGCDTSILAGTEIGSFSVIGAKSLVFGRVPSHSLFVGSPAKFVKTLVSA
jgi:acetyltransferase-like isoleucine patch superfamily enzyme